MEHFLWSCNLRALPVLAIPQLSHFYFQLMTEVCGNHLIQITEIIQIKWHMIGVHFNNY